MAATIPTEFHDLLESNALPRVSHRTALYGSTGTEHIFCSVKEKGVRSCKIFNESHASPFQSLIPLTLIAILRCVVR